MVPRPASQETLVIMSLLTIMSQLAEGLQSSVLIFAITLIGSLPLGLIVCALRMSKVRPVALIARIYISIMRGTPLVLQLLVVYFGPFYVAGIQVSASYRFVAVLIAFILNYAAYFGEIFRSGFLAIPVGQREAALVLGYTRRQTLIHILMPQMIKVVMPSLTNEVITLVKDTSLAYVLSVSEMFSVAKAIAAAQKSMTSFAVAGVFYYLFNALVAAVMERIERRFSYYSS